MFQVYASPRRSTSAEEEAQEEPKDGGYLDTGRNKGAQKKLPLTELRDVRWRLAESL